MEKDTMRGAAILLVSALFYASYGIFSKLIAGGFGPFTQAWTRGVITLLFFVAFGLYKKLFIRIKREDIKWYLVVGIIGSLAIAPTFYSLANLNLGTALFIQYAATIITSYLFGSIFLKEKLATVSFASLLLAFLGLLLVYWGDIHFSAHKIIPLCAAVIAGAFFSVWFVFSKKISSKYPTVQINTIGYIFAIVINFVIAVALSESFNYNFSSLAWLANIGYGIAGFAGSGLSVYGFKFIKAHEGSIILLAEILFGLLFGFILFQEKLNLTTMLGGLLIIAAIVLPKIYQVRPRPV